MPPRQHRSFAPFYALTASLTMGYGVVFTLLAEWRDKFGFTETEVGLIASAGFLSGFVSQLTLARYADRGHTRVLLRLGAAVAAASMVWMVLASDLWGLVAARFLFGIGSGAIVPSVRRLVVHRDPGRMGENLGRLLGFDLGGFVLGPLLGVVFLEIGGIRAPFMVLAGAYAVMLVWTFRLPALDESVAEAATSAPLRSLLPISGVQRSLGMALAFYVTVGTFEALWAVLLDDLGAPTWVIGVTISAFVLPMVLMAPVGGRVSQRFGPIKVCRYSVAVAIGCMLAYGLVGESQDGTQVAWAIAVLSVLAGVHALADAFTMPAIQVAIASAAPAHLTAAAQGLQSAFGLLIALLASSGGGVMYDRAGPFVTFAVASATMVAALVFVETRRGDVQGHSLAGVAAITD